MIFAVQMDDSCTVKIDKFPKTEFENAFDMYYINIIGDVIARKNDSYRRTGQVPAC